MGKFQVQGEGNQNPKGKPHGRTHTTDANTSPASTMVTRDTTELVRRAICTYHRVVRSAQGTILAISGSATRPTHPLPTRRKSWTSPYQGSPCFQASFLNVFIKCRLRLLRLAKLGLPAFNESYISAAVGKPKSGKGRMSFDISSPLEAAVPLDEDFHSCSWLTPRCKKIRLQGQADFSR